MSLELALYAAASHGFNEELTSILQKHEVNINVQNNQGFTPLMVATMNGHMDCVMTLLRNNANVNMRNFNRETALMLAIYGENKYRLNIIKMLIVCGASINAVNSRHENIIMLACQRGLLYLIKLFHHYNCSLFIKDINDNTLMHHACINGNPEIVDFLINNNAPIDHINKFSESPLSLAVEYGNLEIIKKLLKNYAQDHVCNKNGDMLLHQSISMADTDERKEIAKIFIQNSIDINIQNDKGKTAIMIACQNNFQNLVEEILKRYPATELIDIDGNTCLSYALMNNNNAMILCLLAYDPRIINLLNKEGEDAFMQACRTSKYAVQLIYTIEQERIDLNKKNMHGNTALHIAVKSERADIVQYLLTLEIDPTIVNVRGETPMSISLAKGWRTAHYEIIKELRRYFLKRCIKNSLNVKEDICAICMEPAKDVELECGHVYHIVCVLELIDYLTIESKCPLCRRNILGLE